MADPQCVEVGLDGCEVFRARTAQPIRDPRRRGVDGGHRRVLGVEQPQDVALEPVPFELRQLVDMAAEVRRQLLDVRRAAGRVADRVEVNLDPVQTGVAVEAQRELDDLGVDRRTRIADRLDVELPELPIPTGLRTVVAEHRAGHRQLHRLRQRLHAVLDVRPGDAGGRFRPERPRFGFLRSRGEQEELLLDDVGDGSNAPFEDRSLLEERRLDLAVAVSLGEIGRDCFEPPERGPLGGQQVAGSAGRSEGRHRGEV